MIKKIWELFSRGIVNGRAAGKQLATKKVRKKEKKKQKKTTRNKRKSSRSKKPETGEWNVLEMRGEKKKRIVIKITVAISQFPCRQTAEEQETCAKTDRQTSPLLFTTGPSSGFRPSVRLSVMKRQIKILPPLDGSCVQVPTIGPSDLRAARYLLP